MAKLAKKCSAFITVVVLMVGIFSFSVSASSHAPGCSMPMPTSSYSTQTVQVGTYTVAGGVTHTIYDVYNVVTYICPACGANLGSTSTYAYYYIV